MPEYDRAYISRKHEGCQVIIDGRGVRLDPRQSTRTPSIASGVLSDDRWPLVPSRGGPKDVWGGSDQIRSFWEVSNEPE